MGGDFFVCPVCHNDNPKYIAFLNGKPYCRKCITFNKGKKVIETNYHLKNNIKANINYSLTLAQQNASDSLLEYVKANKSVIINAVCGAGKTEIVYQAIEYFLNQNKKVAFAIPRKDVCLEIYNRLKNDYPKIKISLVYGGNTTHLEGQLVVLTTHQLYRFRNYFDFLILDEADAFPYYQNDLLETFLNNSVKGPIAYLSATIKDDYLKICTNVIYVNRRFHNYDLPVPKFIKYNYFNKINVLKEIIFSLKRKQILIFVPTIAIGLKLSYQTNYPFIYSSYKDKNLYIEKFKNKKIQILITTSILERGMTFFDVQVIVYEANNSLFDISSLIQISGRVGRKIKAPTGNIYFLATNKSKAMKDAINEIINKNNEK